ncbi:hypothetical protein LguiB_003559 [Lonicera macranthoides]
MQNILMLRPADGKETACAYKIAALNRMRPSILALSRQKLPHLPGTSIEGIAAKAGDKLRKGGKTMRVMLFVSWELFDDQSAEYKESVLPAEVSARVSIAASTTFGWEKSKDCGK